MYGKATSTGLVASGAALPFTGFNVLAAVVVAITLIVAALALLRVGRIQASK